MVIVKSKYLKNLPDNFSGRAYWNNIGNGLYSGNYYFYFVKNQKLHRYYGASVIRDTVRKEYFFNGKRYGLYIKKYNHKQFVKDLNKQFLK